MMHAVYSLLLALASPTAGPAHVAPVRIGETVDVFTLQDYLGTEHSLDEWADRQAVVIVFLGTECPLAKLYGPRLAELAKTFDARGVSFVGIDSNQQDSLAEIAHYARTHDIEFPILKDPGNTVADQFGAVRTPEVFVLDRQRTVRYHGRVDDQFGVGYARAAATRTDLADALNERLDGKPISQAETEAVGCFIGRVHRRSPTGNVTYCNQISRILQKRCVKCHRPGEIAPFSLISYDEVIGWAETIREVIEIERMPPWHANPAYGKFSNDARMPDQEKQLVYQWIDNGLPEGDPDDLPEPIQFAEGWQIPRPDVVYKMPQPYTVPAQGTVPYQYFMVDPGFKQDMWVRAAEARPGNRRVVHHLILFFHPPDKKLLTPEEPLFNSIAGFAPGLPSEVYPDGYARRIPAGSKLFFQVHYTPNGSEQVDVSEAGLIFADPRTVKKEVALGAAIEWRFRIPPGAENHRVEANHRFSRDMLLYSLLPHMHLRGKSFRYTAQYPDGSEEVLLDVPRYDFNWQNAYLLSKPKRMPEGTVLACSAVFDNSANNLVNPDPTKAVTWGDQTWEEMMVGTFAVGLEEQDLSLGPPQIVPCDDGEPAVRFRYRPPQPVEAVYLAGSFNDWQPAGHKMDGPNDKGFYITTIKLNPGRYEYKFVLDGTTWKSDPGNCEHAGYYHNSVLVVEGQADTRQ